MNEEDKKYLASVKNMTPSLEVFAKMVRILNNVQAEADQLLKDSLPEKA